MNRKKKLLLFLMILFAISITYRIMNPYRQKRVDKLTYTAGLSTKVTKKINTASGQIQMAEKRVLLELIESPPAQSGVAIQNIFSDIKSVAEFYSSDGTLASQSVDKEAIAPPDASPQNRVIEEWDRFTIFGFFQAEDDIVLFLERGKEILTIRRGDKIDGKYTVMNISTQSITLRDDRVGLSVEIDLSD